MVAAVLTCSLPPVTSLYRKTSITCSLANLSFLHTEAEAATKANLYAIVVDRPGNAPLSDEAKATYPVIQSLAELPPP